MHNCLDIVSRGDLHLTLNPMEIDKTTTTPLYPFTKPKGHIHCLINYIKNNILYIIVYYKWHY